MASLPVALLVSGWLLLIAAWDARTRRIPHALTVSGMAAVLLWRGSVSAEALFDGALGVLVGFSLLSAIYIVAQRRLGAGALGFGDVMLAGLLGAVLGVPALLWALAVGLLALGVAAAVLLARGRARRASLPFGPWLVGGALLVLWLSVWR